MSSGAVLKDPSSTVPPSASWKNNEQHVVPKNRLGIVYSGLMCTIFLAALDETIVSTALPTIVAELGAGNNYNWVGSAYMLASAALGPLYGKLSDLVGRKPVLYACIIIFLVASALCGAAQNMTWLIVCRAVQGIGGGGIIQLVEIIISDIVPLKDRAKYSGAIGITWGVSSVIGPLIGGALAEHASWRWCFWINLPTGGISGAFLFFFLNLNPRQGKSFHEHIKEFDFIGLVTVVSGVVCILLGFNSAETAWKSVETISLLVVGGILLVVYVINEMHTRRSAIIPPRLLKTRTTCILLVNVFLQTVVFFTGVYYLPMYYQVLGASPTMSGVKMLPFCIGIAILAVPLGLLIAHAGCYRPIIWGAWAVMTVGWGLMTMLDNTSTIATQGIYPLITALGAGSLFSTQIIALQAAMPQKDMATSTGASLFLTVMGGAVGITIGETIISSTLQQRLRAIPGFDMSISAASINDGIKKIASIPNATLRAQVMHAYARSISMIWLVNTPLSALGFVLSLFIRAYSLQRNVVREGAENANDPEKDDKVQGVGNEARSPEIEERTTGPMRCDENQTS